MIILKNGKQKAGVQNFELIVHKIESLVDKISAAKRKNPYGYKLPRKRD